MPATTHKPRRVGVTALVIAGLIASMVIFVLGKNLSRDLRLLQVSQSENIQWSLSQVEVEFLDLVTKLERAVHAPQPNLFLVRQEFDIFYSRVMTMKVAPIYDGSGEHREFQDAFQDTLSFLATFVPVVDGDDAGLSAALKTFLAKANALRPAIRMLSTSSLHLISTRSDARRNALSNTLLQLAGVIAVMGAIMSGLLVYLYNLNAQNIARGRQIEVARDQALESERSKSEFLAVMSHEIRTPLNGLLGNLSLLGTTALSAPQKQFTHQMEASGRLLLRHVTDVLNIARYNAGSLTAISTTFDLPQLVQDIVDSQRSAASAAKTRLEWRCANAPCKWIIADRDGLQIILSNLVGNAIKFTRNGQVAILLDCDDHGAGNILKITVQDTGIGMAPDLTERVFEDFVTGDSSYDRISGGTGLGLGIARRFARAMGGDITVTSTHGEGSLFCVTLPVRFDFDMSDTAIAPDTLLPGNLRILLVEDNQINRDVARQMLAAQGHQVFEACDGEQGVNAARATPFDVILMDIAMPVMDGRAATRTIRAQTGLNRDTPIIAVTANAMQSEQDAFLADGITRVLVKPVTKESLHMAVASVFSLSPAFLDNHSDDDVDLSPLLPTFITEVTALLDTLHTGSDLDQAPAQLHRLAGSAAVFSALDLRDAFLTVEQSLLDGDIADLPDMLIGLRDVWSETRATL